MEQLQLQILTTGVAIFTANPYIGAPPRHRHSVEEFWKPVHRLKFVLMVTDNDEPIFNAREEPCLHSHLVWEEYKFVGAGWLVIDTERCQLLLHPGSDKYGPFPDDKWMLAKKLLEQTTSQLPQLKGWSVRTYVD